MFAIERWVQVWYGLLLHIHTPRWRHAEAACAHAAGYITALDTTDSELAARLATNHDDGIHPSVRLLAASRDLAWQAITALTAEAHHLGYTRLPTGPNPNWRPVCVREPHIGHQLYPALINDAEPNTPARFTTKAAERISADLSRQTGQHLSLTLTADVLTISHSEDSALPPTRHEPDDDGLYTIGLAWQRVGEIRATGRCPCRSGHANNPMTHNNQIRQYGRCSCTCHRDRR